MNHVTRDKISKRISHLIAYHGLVVYEGAGAFESRGFFHKVEYTMHELAHVLTLGSNVFPPGHLSTHINDSLGALAVTTRDSLEIDTNVVVWKAGAHLSLWGTGLESDEARMLASSCARNLDSEKKVSAWDMLSEFDHRRDDSILGDAAMNLVEIVTGTDMKYTEMVKR